MISPVPAPATAAPWCPWWWRTPSRRSRPDPDPAPTTGRASCGPVHGHEETGMDPEDDASRRLAPGGHAADGPGSGHAAAARRDESTARRSGRRPADRPDPRTVPEPVDASDHQRRAGPSLAAKKAVAVVNIPFTRLNRAASAREPFNSAIAPRPTA